MRCAYDLQARHYHDYDVYNESVIVLAMQLMSGEMCRKSFVRFVLR